jgi:hypothetical protein
MINKLKGLLIIVILLFRVGNSLACSCESVSSLEEAFNYSDAVFHGKVVNKSLVTYAESIRKEAADSIRKNLDENKLSLFDYEFILKVEFEIKTCFKGNIFNDTIVIYTTRTSASCGYTGFEVGKDYIVYGSLKSYAFWAFIKNSNAINFEKQNTFWTNHCTRTDVYTYEEAKRLEKIME